MPGINFGGFPWYARLRTISIATCEIHTLFTRQVRIISYGQDPRQKEDLNGRSPLSKLLAKGIGRIPRSHILQALPEPLRTSRHPDGSRLFRLLKSRIVLGLGFDI